MSVAIIIVAAGSGERMKGKDKIFEILLGREVLAWSADTAESSPLIDEMVIVLREADVERGCQLARNRQWAKLSKVCPGGKRRQDSVLAGIASLKRKPDWLLIHDGARPFLTESLIVLGLEAARETGAAVAAVPVSDTIKVVDDEGVVVRTLDRRELWAAQTPQIFHYDIIASAYQACVTDVTDDASLVESLGQAVKVYYGEPENIKITTPGDWLMAESIGRRRIS